MLKWISILCVAAYLTGCKQNHVNSDSGTLTASSINHPSLLREGEKMPCSLGGLSAENVSRCEDIANDFADASVSKSAKFDISCGEKTYDVVVDRGTKGTREYKSAPGWLKDGLVQAAKVNGNKCTVTLAN